MSIEVKVGKSEISTLLQNLKNTKPLLNEIGKYLVNSTRERISLTKTAPDGSIWKQWSPATALARKKDGTASGGLLYRTGALANSISYKVSNDEVEITASAKYASFLQLGTSRMPARPFLGISLDDSNAIGEIIKRQIKV